MAREFAKSFYNSKEWLDTRNYIMAKYNYVCQGKGCNKPAKIVHHIIHLEPNNIEDKSISLDEKNLIPLCQDCHNQEHGLKSILTQEGLTFDSNGDLKTT